MTYTDEEVRDLCVKAFETGRRVERAAHRTPAPDDTMAVADAVGVTRTRGHLTLVWSR